jgi:hypothetical protein
VGTHPTNFGQSALPRVPITLKPCLIEEGNSTSNQLWRIPERTAMKDFMEGNRVYVQWIEKIDGHSLAG